MPLYVRTFIYINFTATVTASPRTPTSVPLLLRPLLLLLLSLCSSIIVIILVAGPISTVYHSDIRSVQKPTLVQRNALCTSLYFTSELVKCVYRNLRFIICKMKLKSGLVLNNGLQTGTPKLRASLLITCLTDDI